MALFNYATKEITLKIVYYGPGLSGKTTNLQHLHAVMNPETKGKLLSLSTEADRTLFFDFMPVELGKIRDFSIRFQLYTVPGQVRYNATRKVVLKGADAVVFVADSQKDMREQNIESFENMRENLISNNINPDAIPVLLQYNKRDLRNILTIEELNSDLNRNRAHELLEAAAINGTGVEETFKLITKLLLKDIARKHKIEIQPAEEKMQSKVSGAPEPLQRLRMPEPGKKPEPATVSLKAQEPQSFSDEPVFEADSFLADEEKKDISRKQRGEIRPAGEITPPKITEAPAPPERPRMPEPEKKPEPFEVSPEARQPQSFSGESVFEANRFTKDEEELEIVSEFGGEESGSLEEAEAAVVEPDAGTMFSPGRYKPDTAAEVRAAAPESFVTESAPALPESRVMTERRTEPVRADLPPFPVEKIDALADMIGKLSGNVLDIEAELRSVQRTLSNLKGEILLMKNDLAMPKPLEPKGPELKDLKEFKELRREQKEASNLLKDVLDLLGSLKEKKSWFRF